ncbi:MAG: SMI1/KNR4 family protein [Acutalibacteraceae bacterium]
MLMGTGSVKGPSKDTIAEAEKEWGVRFPDSYIQFLSENNGVVPKAQLFMCEGREYLVERFLCLLDDELLDKLEIGCYDILVIVSQIFDCLTDDDEAYGVQLMPIADLFAGDLVCLDYRTDKQEPEVCVWAHEESEELAPCTYKIADTFDDFLKMLYEPKD